MKSNAKGPRVWPRMIPDVACEHLRWPLYALAVHPPRRIPAALNGFALWNVLVLLVSCSRMAIPLAFTSDNTARFSGDFTSINPGGFGSNWCGSSFVVSGRFDLTAMANLK
jgi:hypothetical protein